MHLRTFSSLSSAERDRQGPSASPGGRHFLPGVPDATAGRSQPHTKGPRGKRGNRCPFATEGTAETGSWGQCRTCYHGQGPRSPAAGTQRQSCGRRRDRGSRCSAPAGAAQAPRKQAARGSRGERRGQAAQAPSVLQVPCVSAFPFSYSVKMFEDFFRSKTKQNNPRLVHLRRSACAAFRTHNLLIFPANIGELHNGI